MMQFMQGDGSYGLKLSIMEHGIKNKLLGAVRYSTPQTATKCIGSGADFSTYIFCLQYCGVLESHQLENRLAIPEL